MASVTSLTTWDLGPVLNLLRAFSVTDTLEPSFELSTTPPGEHEEPRPARIGDLNAVLRLMGKPIDVPTTKSSPLSPNDSSTSPAGSYSTDASSPPSEDVLDFEDLIKNKEVRFADSVIGSGSLQASAKSRASDKQSWKTLDSVEISRLINSTSPIKGEESGQSVRKKQEMRTSKRNKPYASDLESDGEALPRPSRVVLASASLLTPAWVTPLLTQPSISHSERLIVPPDLPHIQVHRSTIQPFLTLTREEKKALLVRKLMNNFTIGPFSQLQSNATHVAATFGGNTATDGVHVFVDASNIVIGFWNALKVARGLSKHEFTKRAPFDYHSLSLVLERGRSVAKRVLCGSLEASDIEPDYMVDARRCGYNVSVLKRVEKVRPITIKKKRGGNGYATSGPSSGSEAYEKPMPNVGEQAVDELLQLHMCTSVLEYEKPATMVLATGDAAEAEYSGGFQKYVELALAKGWKVELVCWKDGMSYAWIRPDFLKKWKRQFTIINLDDYREELFADYVMTQPSMHIADW